MAYSVAMDIIMACDEIRMGLGTSMFLHNPWTRAQGNASQLRSMADQLDALTDASVQLYMSRAKNLTEESLRQMMEKETMLAPDTCLGYGFCDFVGEQRTCEPDDDPDDPDDPDEDCKKQIKELQQQLFQQKQINQMLQRVNKPSMQNTFLETLKQLAE